MLTLTFMRVADSPFLIIAAALGGINVDDPVAAARPASTVARRRQVLAATAAAAVVLAGRRLSAVARAELYAGGAASRAAGPQRPVGPRRRDDAVGTRREATQLHLCNSR